MLGRGHGEPRVLAQALVGDERVVIAGGTDVAPFPQREGGAVLSATMSQYCFTTLRPRLDGQRRRTRAGDQVVEDPAERPAAGRFSPPAEGPCIAPPVIVFGKRVSARSRANWT